MESLEEENGLDLLTEVQKHSPDLPVIMLTAHGTIETAMEAVQRGAYGFLTKPFHDHDLLQKLQHGVERSCVPPTGVKRRSCRARRSLTWTGCGASPISSRKMVPPSAAAK